MYASDIFVGKKIDSVSQPNRSHEIALKMSCCDARSNKISRIATRFQIYLGSKSVLCTIKPQRHIESLKVKYGKREVEALKSEVR